MNDKLFKNWLMFNNNTLIDDNALNLFLPNFLYSILYYPNEGLQLKTED